MSDNNQNQYFAAKAGTDTASILLSKGQTWFNSINSNGYLDKLKAAYAAYHGAYYSDTGSGHQITFSGEQGELVNLPVNHYRNIAQHILVMTTSNRPTMEARATNTDYKSLVQTILANNILEYYMREKKLENYLKKAVEMAIVMGAGFIKLEWDATQGELVDYIEETKTKIFEGDLLFNVLSPLDVVVDGTKENNDHDWTLVRSWKNRFDLAAKYKDLQDKILQLPTKSDMEKVKVGMNLLLDETDDIAVYEFYHKRTDAMPDGRYMMFLSEDVILQDLPMPYRVMPIFRISASDILGTPHGYTPMFDLLPLQDLLNSLYSACATNVNAFGVQNVLNPRGSDIAVNQLQGGLNVIDYNPQAGKPEALQLCATPGEVFKLIEMIQTGMETISGVNSVARGNPEASLKSGTALALVQSMALQFISGLQSSYVQLVENIGGAMIKILQDFANTPRLITIAGKTNRTYMKEFTSDDIANISRVTVDIGNPMARTTAGRVQMAQELIQYGEITPRQYVNIIHTGNLDDVTEDTVHENLLMRAENEALLDGEQPLVAPIDAHKEHIDYHKRILFDPELRKDVDLVNRTRQHIQLHVDALRTVDPDLLMLIGQQPLAPKQPPAGPGGPPPGPPGPVPPKQLQQGNADQMMPPNQGLQGMEVQGGKVMGPGMDSPVRVPSVPSVDPSLLPNAQLQEQSMGNLRG